MPYKHIEMLIPETKDRRCKLTKAERAEIKELYGTISQRKLAKMFGVSRRLIIFIGCPEKHAENLRQRAERGGSKAYYDKDKWREQMKRHRKHKQKLYVKGELIAREESKNADQS